MSEIKIRPDSPTAQHVRAEIGSLIQEGCVLSIKDLNEIAAKHRARSGTYIMSHLYRTFGTGVGFSENHQTVYYDIAGAATTATKYKRHRLLVSRDLPLDQTEWAEVTKEIDDKLHKAGVKSGQSAEASRKKFSRPRLHPW